MPSRKQLIMSGGILDLSKQTGTDKILGPFWGDPLKTLHIEADNRGAVVYWCTGQGLQVSPLWYLVLKKLLDQLKDMINRLKKMIEKVIEGVKPVIDAIQNFINSIVNWGAEHSKVLAFILLVILLIISILAEPVSLGSSTVGIIGSVMAMVIIVVGLGALIGINADNLPNATANLAKSLFPREGNAAMSAADVNALNRKINEDFETFMFPFYNKFTHLNDVIQYLIEENKRLNMCINSFRLAVIMAKLGRKEESKKFFKESIRVKEAIAQAARYHGIDLND
ncbi:MAG: hypothetical protein JXJ04_25670 [Spirochaetales bacterium]|nr:hypothetical protein [Spirochaetales bacterium]